MDEAHIIQWKQINILNSLVICIKNDYVKVIKEPCATENLYRFEVLITNEYLEFLCISLGQRPIPSILVWKQIETNEYLAFLSYFQLKTRLATTDGSRILYGLHKRK